MAEEGDGPGSPADWADGRGGRQGDAAGGGAEDDGGGLGGDNADATDVTEPVGGRPPTARPVVLAVDSVSVARLIGGMAPATRDGGDMRRRRRADAGR